MEAMAAAEGSGRNDRHEENAGGGLELYKLQ